MSVSKALQFMEKKDLECAICLNRFHQPKTLKCMHTYCLQCIQKWVETHGKMKCPICGQEHDLTKEDLKKLSSNTMISHLLHYVLKTEEQKPTKCSVCDNEPAYHCSTCHLYLCGGNCIKQHKIVPLTRDHPLYTLDMKEQDGTTDKQMGEQDDRSDKIPRCPAHHNTLEFYCSTCSKSACKQCEQILRCYQKQHIVIPMSTAVEDFNKDVTEVVNLAHRIKSTLTDKLESIVKIRSVFDSQLMLCKTAIEMQEKNLTKKVQEKSKQLISNLEKICKRKREDIDNIIKDIDSKTTQVNTLMVSINKMLNKPEEREILGSYKTTISSVRDTVLGPDCEQSFQKRNITPIFIPSTNLDELIDTEGIGNITITDDMMYNYAEGNESIDTKGKPFVKVSELAERGACQLATTLRKTSSETSDTNVEYQHDVEEATKKIGQQRGAAKEKTDGVIHEDANQDNFTAVLLESIHPATKRIIDPTNQRHRSTERVRLLVNLLKRDSSHQEFLRLLKCHIIKLVKEKDSRAHEASQWLTREALDIKEVQESGTFRLIIVADKEVVHERFPIPLINRLEKHFLAMTTMLNEDQLRVVKQLEDWVTLFTTIKHQRHLQAPKQSFKKTDAFVGYHGDTIAALVYQSWASCDGESEVFEKVKDQLLTCATPESVTLLSKTNMSDEERESLTNTYFRVQKHGCLAEYLADKIQKNYKEEATGILAQVTTYSRLLIEEDSEALAESTRIDNSHINMISLQEFQHEQQFSHEVQ
ncbi:E3 ubiquitin-protein ligase rnf213-alpha-like [Anneissia japonica]|uniref:E3 ubiquitin-protein ligase rnf213-alpha-like n=1 Tax=Anneissia japonica TaxID=1529436 RepID=UPI00142573A3|nr:E3 ubiquitin-protein ligase rnf213-alpha-like [Anneissia japonica]